MKYRSKPVEVLAWKYDPKADVPIWVFRRCHKLSTDDVLTCVLTELGPMTREARQGEWIVFNETSRNLAVMTDEDFTRKFESAA